MCKILIEMEEGKIVKVLTDRKMQVVIIDKGEIDYGMSPVQLYDPEIIKGDFKTEYAATLDIQDQEIYDTLKEKHL